MQVELFSGNRMAMRPFCADDFADGVYRRSREKALKKRYIQVNAEIATFRFVDDIDRPSGAFAWQDAGLPPPNWIATNPLNGHAHIGYELEIPIRNRVEESKAMRYGAAVQYAYTRALGADTHYTGLIMKNPHHGDWIVETPRIQGFSLDEMAEYVSVKNRAPRKEVAEALWRNCSVFNRLRKWAYGAVRKFWDLGQQLWRKECDKEAATLNTFPNPLPRMEVAAIGKSVADWVWKKFTEYGFKRWQSRAGIKSAAKRWKGYEDKQASAKLMRADGKSLSFITDELGIDRTTLCRWQKVW